MKKLLEPHRSANTEQRKDGTLHTVLRNSQSDILSDVLFFGLDKPYKVTILSRPEILVT